VSFVESLQTRWSIQPGLYLGLSRAICAVLWAHDTVSGRSHLTYK